MIRRKRFLLEHIEHRSGDVPALQGIEQGLIVQDAAAGEVRDDRAPFEERELARSDHAAGLVRERCMDREYVGDVQQLLESRRTAYPQRGEAVVADVWIESMDVHSERVRPARDLRADAPDADDAEPAPLQFTAHEIGSVPLAADHRRRGLRDLPDEADQRSEEKL